LPLRLVETPLQVSGVADAESEIQKHQWHNEQLSRSSFLIHH
jgi:hypothetical protein